jgi:hypothetical protein
MFENLKNAIETRRTRSAWDRGVKEYALDLVEELEYIAEYEGRRPDNARELERWMLNGAADWKQYSEGGCALIYNRQIAERLCTPSELKKTDGGRKDPNPHESWIDVQSRALYQAAQLVFYAWHQVEKEAQ